MSLIAELKRRKVFKVAAGYAVVGWLVVQVATSVLPLYDTPAWFLRAFVLVVLLGFPIALVLAWVFDVTPEGIKVDASRAGSKGIFATAVVLIALAVAWYFHREMGPESSSGDVVSQSGKADQPENDSGPISNKSIAVMPLVNESDDKDQQYFSDGLSESLITALSQFTGLKVIGRNSSFRFRNSRDDSATIGRKLGVAHLLEGSVQRAGDQVRIRAELVNTADGSTLWSQQYDRAYQDLFALQDEITRAVTDALKARLLDGGGAVSQDDHPPGGSLAAYNAFLQAQFHAQRQSAADVRNGIGFYRQAIALDAGYAAAYAGLAQAQLKLVNYFLNEPADRQQAIEAARTAADKALSLRPGLAMAHLARADVLLFSNFDWQGQREELQRALQLAPGDSQVRFVLGRSYAAFGEVRRGVELMEQALATDPLCAECHYLYSLALPALGRDDDAVREVNKALELAPDNDFARGWLVLMEARRGELEPALRRAREIRASPVRDLSMAVALARGDDRAAADAALSRAIQTFGVGSAYQIAQVYALRGQPDQMFAWLEHAYAGRDPGLTLLLGDVGILKYRSDPRFAAFCRKVGLPVPKGDSQPPVASDGGAAHG